MTDFGQSRETIYGKEIVSEKPFPARWSAIECFTEKRFSQSTDVWSFGVLAWEVHERVSRCTAVPLCLLCCLVKAGFSHRRDMHPCRRWCHRT